MGQQQRFASSLLSDRRSVCLSIRAGRRSDDGTKGGQPAQARGTARRVRRRRPAPDPDARLRAVQHRGPARGGRRVEGRLLPLLRLEAGAARGDRRSARRRGTGPRRAGRRRRPHDARSTSSAAIFRTIAAFKAEQRDFVLQLMKVWYSDDNAIVREKLRHEQIHRVTPHIADDHSPGRRRRHVRAGRSGPDGARRAGADPRHGRRGRRAVRRASGRTRWTSTRSCAASTHISSRSSACSECPPGRSSSSTTNMLATLVRREPQTRHHTTHEGELMAARHPDREADQVLRQAPRHHRRRPRGQRGRGRSASWVPMARARRRRSGRCSTTSGRPSGRAHDLRHRHDRGSGRDPQARSATCRASSRSTTSSPAARRSTTSPTCAAASTGHTSSG